MINLQDYTKYFLSDSDKDGEKIDLEVVEKLKNISQASDNIIIFPSNNSDRSQLTVVKEDNNEIWTQQYVGLLQIEREEKTENIFIKSRFDKNDNCEFSQYILNKALGLKTRIFQNMEPSVGYGTILHTILGFIFVSQIERAYKKGVYRKYRTYERNDAKVKGRIDIARDIHLNPIFNGKIAYSERSYTPDNNTNRMILTAYTMLEKRQPDVMRELAKQKKLVGECISYFKTFMAPASRQEIQKIVYQERKKITHAVYADWEPVRKTAVLILKHMGIKVSEEDNTQINGVLINMNWVWEQYLKCILEENLPEGKYLIKGQHGMETFFGKDKSGGKQVLRPDLMIWNSDKDPRKDSPIFIIDAKYKNQWKKAASVDNKAESNEWERNDYLQILAYMYRARCDKGSIFCPGTTEKKEEVVEKQEYAVRDEDDDSKFYILPIKVNHIENIQKTMSEREENFANMVLECIE